MVTLFKLRQPPNACFPILVTLFGIAAKGECHVSDRGHAVRNRYTGQSNATGECVLPDRGHAVRNRYTGQTKATGEFAVSNLCYTTWYSVRFNLFWNPNQLFIIYGEYCSVRIFFIVSISRSNNYLFNTPKNIFTDRGHAVRNRYTGHIAAKGEYPVTDRGHCGGDSIRSNICGNIDQLFIIYGEYCSVRIALVKSVTRS